MDDWGQQRRVRVTLVTAAGETVHEVPVTGGTSVLSVLDHVQRHLRPDLAYLASCRRGFCDVCLVKVNGRVVRSCLELVGGDALRIEPARADRAVRDLVLRP